MRVTEILAQGAGNSGVKAALGSGTRMPGAATETDASPAPKAKKADGAPAKAEKSAAKAEPVTEGSGRRPANLLDAPRDEKADDLKKITGVGPKMEGLLHGAGVYHFDQIAAWDADEVAYIDDQLSFKGRIERDNWIEQAKQFAAEEE